MRTGGSVKHPGDEHLSEKLGRGRAGKRRRKLEEKETEKLMEKLMEREGKGGSTGAKYLAAIDAKNKNMNKVKKGPKGAGEGGSGTDALDGEVDGENDEADAARKRVFGAEAVKKIGFDPTSKRGERDEDQSKRVSRWSRERERHASADGRGTVGGKFEEPESGRRGAEAWKTERAE